VASDNFLEAPLQRINPQHASQTQADSDVVSGRSGIQLLQKPETLLREGERHIVQVVRARHDTGRRRAFSAVSCAKTFLQLLELSRR